MWIASYGASRRRSFPAIKWLSSCRSLHGYPEQQLDHPSGSVRTSGGRGEVNATQSRKFHLISETSRTTKCSTNVRLIATQIFLIVRRSRHTRSPAWKLFKPTLSRCTDGKLCSSRGVKECSPIRCFVSRILEDHVGAWSPSQLRK